jgi:hypothetical protein
VDDGVDGAGQLVAHGPQRPRRRGLDDQCLEAMEGIERTVGMARRPRAVVPGIERLDEPEHLRAMVAFLTNDSAALRAGGGLVITASGAQYTPIANEAMKPSRLA